MIDDSDVRLPDGRPLRNSEFNLDFVCKDGVVTVTRCSQPIMKGDAEDYRTLCQMLHAERDRMIAEISDDIARGKIDPSAIHAYGDLDDQCDANLYISGGRCIDGSRDDTKREWSDSKGDQHLASLLGQNVIGKGFETIRLDDWSSSLALVQFHEAVTDAVDLWIKGDGFAQLQSRPGRRP